MAHKVDYPFFIKKQTIVRNGKRHKIDPFTKSFGHGCQGKMKFKRLSAAENHILKHFPEDFTMVPYRCDHCGRYHIGHTKRSERL